MSDRYAQNTRPENPGTQNVTQTRQATGGKGGGGHNSYCDASHRRPLIDSANRKVYRLGAFLDTCFRTFLITILASLFSSRGSGSCYVPGRARHKRTELHAQSTQATWADREGDCRRFSSRLLLRRGFGAPRWS